MNTRIFRCIGRGLSAASLSLFVALAGCADPGTDLATETKKDEAAMGMYSDLTKITDPAEKAAAEAFKQAGADVFVMGGSVTDVSFGNGGCDDAMAANLAKTPKLERLTLTNCTKVTDASVVTISALKGLKMVSIQGSGITNSGAKKIMDALPKDTTVMHPAIQMMQQPGGSGPGAGAPGPGGPGGPPGR